MAFPRRTAPPPPPLPLPVDAQSVALVPNFVQRTVMQHGSPSDVLPVVAECNALSDQADYWTRLFVFGAATDLFPKSSGAVISGAAFGPVDGPAFQAAAFLDACPFVASFGRFDSSLVGPFASPACHSVAAGVVGRGFVGTVVYQLSVARATCAARGLATVLDLASGVGTTSGGAPYSIPAVLASGPVSDMFNISDNYGLPGEDATVQTRCKGKLDKTFAPPPPPQASTACEPRSATTGRMLSLSAWPAAAAVCAFCPCTLPTCLRGQSPASLRHQPLRRIPWCGMQGSVKEAATPPTPPPPTP